MTYRPQLVLVLLHHTGHVAIAVVPRVTLLCSSLRRSNHGCYSRTQDRTRLLDCTSQAEDPSHRPNHRPSRVDDYTQQVDGQTSGHTAAVSVAAGERTRAVLTELSLCFRTRSLRVPSLHPVRSRPRDGSRHHQILHRDGTLRRRGDRRDRQHQHPHRNPDQHLDHCPCPLLASCVQKRVERRSGPDSDAASGGEESQSTTAMSVRVRSS